MICSLNHTKLEGLYSVTAPNRATLAALFTCAHCAEEWRREHLPHGQIAQLQLDVELFRQLVNETANVVVIQNTDDSATARALHE